MYSINEFMPLTATVVLRKKKHVSGKTYFYIHIPSKVSSDTQFKFREGEVFKLIVDPSRKRIILNSLGKRAVVKRKDIIH